MNHEWICNVPEEIGSVKVITESVIAVFSFTKFDLYNQT